jgi:hypothetical protein
MYAIFAHAATMIAESEMHTIVRFRHGRTCHVRLFSESGTFLGRTVDSPRRSRSHYPGKRIPRAIDWTPIRECSMIRLLPSISAW